MSIWKTDIYPEIGDFGQFDEFDAEIVNVHPVTDEVTVEIYYDEETDILTIPFRIC